MTVDSGIKEILTYLSNSKVYNVGMTDGEDL
jgi:hypothetical protein